MSYSFTVFHRDIAVAHVFVSDNHKEVVIEKITGEACALMASTKECVLVNDKILPLTCYNKYT